MFGDPFKGAVTVVVVTSKDAAVPFKEVGFFLVEELKFGDKETIEVAEHKSRRGVSEGGELGPIEVGLDVAVAVGGTEVGCEGIWVCSR